MANLLMKLVTKLISTRFFIRILYNTRMPKNKEHFQTGFATLQLRNALKKYVKKGDKVLDMGCGALCILSIYLKKNKKDIKITAVEVTDKLVTSAKKSVEFNGVDIEVRKSDLFSDIEQDFDIIGFNPPFLGNDTFMLIDKFLKYAKKSTIIISSNRHYINLNKLEKTIKDNDYKIIDIVKDPFNPAKAYILRKF